jgi:hypothetical protein
MRESNWDVQLSAVRSGQSECGPAAECWRARANVNGDVEDLAFDRGHELRLSVRVLEMETAYDPAAGTRQVVLYEGREARRSRMVVAPKLYERPSRIAKDVLLQDSQFRKVRSVVSIVRHRDCSFEWRVELC